MLAGLSVAALVKGTEWCGVLVAKGARHFWRRPAAAARALVEDMRERAKADARELLPRLDALETAELVNLRRSQLVIIFMHGLLSTDLGTFDGFIDRLVGTNPIALLETLREQNAQTGGTLDPIIEALDRRLGDAAPETRQKLTDSAGRRLRKLVGDNIGIVGWPHNTLTSIEENGSSLADLILRVFESDDRPSLVFVCHSRGGLVARAAVRALLDVDRGWASALVDCITFGTPHEGAALAQHGARGLAVQLLMLQATQRVTSMLDVLVYLDANTAEGIEQLGPTEATTESRERAYLSRLFELERDLRGGLGRRVPPIVAVGGAVDAEILESWRRRATSAFLGSQMGETKHDLVVPLRSSTSCRVDPDIAVETCSDHFGYFAERETGKIHFDIILGRIWSTIDLDRAVQRMSRSDARPSIHHGPASVTVGGVRLQHRRARIAPIEPDLVEIPPGTFMMGSPESEEDRYDDEGPQHEVRIAHRLAVGRYPVTFEEYDRFAAATGRELPHDDSWGRGRRPVIDVSWDDAKAYVQWLSEETGNPYRLLSEAEWEYACRAGTTTRFSWGDDISPKNANYEGNVGRTTEVGAYAPNPWGLHDMHGNVWEWVEDCWHGRYDEAPQDGRAWLDEDDGDPAPRVLRGGSWAYYQDYARCALRARGNPDLRAGGVGFRVVCSSPIFGR